MTYKLAIEALFIIVQSVLQQWLDVEAMRDSIEMIEENSGSFLYSQDEYQTFHHIERGRPPGPFVIRAFLGDDFFATVVDVNLNQHGFSGGFGGEQLDANGQKYVGLTDQELAKLVRGLPSLQSLSLVGNNRLSAEAITSLEKLKSLRFLELNTTHINPKDIGRLHATNANVQVRLNGEIIPRD